ncbi:MAG TPA: PKD domain-containing protein [Thermoanaerobaculia bacterium]|nr:PKD domain-containing protein [Thermoanaerobaculia bacterium]
MKREPITFNIRALYQPGDNCPLEYKWVFDDGAIEIGTPIAHQFASAGVHHGDIETITASGLIHVPVTVTIV